VNVAWSAVIHIGVSVGSNVAMQALVRHQLDSRDAAAINWTIERRVCHRAEIELGTGASVRVVKSEVHE
jgi:hypothetical protein